MFDGLAMVCAKHAIIFVLRTYFVLSFDKSIIRGYNNHDQIWYKSHVCD